MRFVTWNVNSLKARQDLVALFLQEEAPDVLCLQELKLPTEAVPTALFAEAGYEVAVFGQPQWNGVLIASRHGLTDVHTGLPPADEGQARLVAATVAGVRLINLYCPQGQSVDSPKFPYKLAFYDALIDWLATSRGPLVVTGDLNVAPAAEDIFDPIGFANQPSFHPEEHARWGRLLGLGLADAARPFLPPNTYTFWDYRAGAFNRNLGMRIDHFLVSEELVPRVRGAVVHRSWRKKRKLADGDLAPSDHAPVALDLDLP